MLKWLLNHLRREPKTTDRPWLIDRDGRVYMPSKRVVLKARTTA